MNMYKGTSFAQLTDVNELTAIYRTIHKTYKDTDVAFDEESVREFLDNNIKSDDSRIIIYRVDGVIKGVCTFFLFSPFFNKHAKHSAILTLWVDPSARNDGIGQALLNECERISKTQKCSQVIVGIHRSDSYISEYFIKKGYKIMDNMHIRGIQ